MVGLLRRMTASSPPAEGALLPALANLVDLLPSDWRPDGVDAWLTTEEPAGMGTASGNPGGIFLNHGARAYAEHSSPTSPVEAPLKDG